MTRTTAIDLFAGLGGFSEGARQNGLSVAWAANHWPEAVATHRLNHPETEHSCQDLMQADFARLGIDLADGILMAAPACQGHSTAGQPAARGTGGNGAVCAAALRSKHQADRNTAWAVLAAADSLRPRTVIVENVPKFVQWSLFGAWAGVLESMGYAVRTQVLNAARFGSCQDRNRMILVASRDGAIDLDGGTDDAGSYAAKILDPDDAPGNRWSEIGRKSERMRVRMRKAQVEAGSRCLWNNVSESRGRPLEGLCPTITTRSGSQLYLLDGDRARILNPRELARAQGFPDSYALPKSRDLAGRMIGNAIDVNLSRAVVAQVLAA